jgi:hypothetical protein
LRKQVLSQIKEKQIQAGDLVRVDWNDASVGKSLSGGLFGIDIPVFSIGIFLGVLGDKKQYIVLGQNHFRYADGLYDIDYTSVPITWTVQITVITKAYISPEEANKLVTSFLMGGRLPRRIKQQRISNHKWLTQ